MLRLNAKNLISLSAAVAFAFAPAAFAAGQRHGHARGGYGGGHHSSYTRGYHGGARYYGGNSNYRGNSYYRGGRYYHRDSAGRWIAGALITGAVVGLVANALAPPPPVYYPTRRVVYEQAPVVVQPRVVYQPGTVYQDSDGTQYVGPDDDYDQ